MKKLMIALAAATTAMFSFGDFTSTGFENSPYVAGELLSTTNDDAGKVAGESGFAATWVALPADVEEEHTIKAYDAEGAEPTPTKFASEVGSQYLYVETATSNLLERYVQPGGAAASIGDGIYLDTLVKFTPADQPFVESDVANGDKIAISYVGQDPSEVGDGETPISNIVVRAGYVSGSSIVSTNYVMNLPDNADFDVNAWHRLTVRSIANVGSTVAPVGFAIYIDGNPKPLTYASNVAAGDSAYEGALNAAVKTYLYSDTKHALLPSLVDSTYNGYNELTTVGFKGSGCVDNLAFTANPGFIEEGTAVEIAWDEGVATYTVVDSENNTLVDGAATGGTEGSTNLLLEVGITYLTVTATYGTGYEAGTWTVTGDGAAISGGTFTVAEGAKLNINSMTPKFDVGGVHYGTFADALAAAVAAGTSAEPATIRLLADVTEAMTFAEGYIVLDLNGKTIACGSGSRYVLANTGAVLKIVDTATGGIVATGSSGSILIRGDAAFTTIEAGKYDGTIAITGLSEVERTDILVVNGGTFYDEDYVDDPENGFYLKDNVPDGVSISEPDNGYFTVGGGEPPAPQQVAVPQALIGIIYDGTLKTGVVENVGYTLTGNTGTNAGSYEATATLSQGYIWSDNTTEAKVISWGINPDNNAEVVVTLTSEIAEYSAQLEFPTASATIGGDDVAGTPAWDPNAITEPEAGATNTYTVTFTVTTANYAGSTGTATFKVYKAAGGEYPTYIDEITDPTTKEAYETKYDTWKTTYEADATSTHEAAFLLNIAPNAADQTLEPVSITMEGGKVVISANQTLTAVNGKVYVKVATTLAGLATAEWTEATLDEGKVQVTPGSSDTAGFYKIKVDF